MDLSHLTDEQLKQEELLIERIVLHKRAYDNMSDFCKIMMPDPADPNDVNKSEYQSVGHSKMLCEIVQNLESGKSRRIAVSIAPQHGKPIYEEELVLMGNGSRKKLKNVEVNDWVIGKSGESRRVLEVFDQGELQCVTLKTKSGRKITAAIDHPMLTPGGWVNAGDIMIGMSLTNIVPQYDSVESTDYDSASARLAGYFIGDGSCVTSDNGKGYDTISATITVVDDVELEDIISCCNVMGFEYRINNPKNRAKNISLSGGVRNWLRDTGLAGKNSHTKRVPDFVFEGDVDLVSNFLGAYFACDGSINKKGLDRHGKQRKDICAEFYSVSEGLIDDVQHLLLRIGVQSTKGIKSGKYKGGLHISWRLTLTSQDYVTKFADIVPVYHSKSANFKTWAGFRTQHDSLYISDPVVDIQTDINARCKCLSVEFDKSFVANDFVVHNTAHLSLFGLAWIWGRNPRARIVVATYNQDRANELGQEFRQMIKDRPVYAQVFPNIKFLKDAKSKSSMQNEQGGKAFFIGIGGTITGRTADYFIIDDPLKGEADGSDLTPRHLESLWGWFFKVAYSRGNNKTRICLVQTRWSLDDLVGRLVDEDHPERNKRYAGIAENWEYLNIPGVVKSKKLADALGLKLKVQTNPKVVAAFGTDPMCALWEKEKDLEFFAQWKAGDPRSFSALVMGSPSPEGGSFFKEDMIVEYGPGDLPKNLRYYAASDHAISLRLGADYTVLGCVGVDEKDNIWVMPDVVIKRMESLETVEKILEKMKQYKPLVWWMEDEMISKTFGPLLRKRMHETRTYVFIKPVRPSKNKEARAASIQGRMDMKKVFFPRFAPWFLDAKNQMLKFPDGANDDFVDWLAYIGLGMLHQHSAEKDAPLVDVTPQTNTIAWIKQNCQSQIKEIRNGW